MRRDPNVLALIARFSAQWGDPNTPDDEAFLAEFMRALAGTAPDVLKRAGDSCIDSEEYWPRVSVVKRHIAQIIARRDMGKVHGINRDERPPQSPEARARVDELYRTTIAKLASTVPLCGEGKLAEPAPLADVSRPAFEARMKASRNTKLHGGSQ